MITETNQSYWSTGISLRWHEHCGTRNGVRHGGWSGRVGFLDDGFCSDDTDAGRVSTEGELHTRYGVPDGESATGLSLVVDTLMADAARLGIAFRDPSLYYRGDGEWEDSPPPPGWREALAVEAARVGWKSAYAAEPGSGGADATP